MTSSSVSRSPSLRVIFAGTPEFAARALAALIDSRHEVIAVYTQPDRPSGRGRKLKASPVKQLALESHLPVYQPADFKSPQALADLGALDADVMVVAAYGLLLPPTVLETPPRGCLNIHASLLPRWRGAAPIQRAILAGDRETGVTIMQMDEGLDTGAMLLKRTCPITDTTSAASLHEQLASLGAQAIVEALDRLDELEPEAQNDSQATYARKLSKEEGRLDWRRDAAELHRQIRAFNPVPVAYTEVAGQNLRIRDASLQQADVTAQPGTVIAASKQGIDVACGQGVLRLLNLQPPGKKAMDVAAFYNGYADLLPVGTRLGQQSDKAVNTP